MTNVTPLFGNINATPAPHDPYRLEPDIEASLLRRICEEPVMWAKLGQYLDPNALALPGAREVVSVARAIVRDTGRPPRGARDVIQGISAMHAEGKVTLDLKAAVAGMLASPRTKDDDDILVRHVGLILRRRLHKEAARVAVGEASARGDGSRVMELYELARRVGQAAPGETATRIGVDTLVELSRSQRIQRAPMGILELDSYLNGGLPCGCLGVLMAATGVGKSMGLIHLSVANALQGRVVAYFTGELNVEDAKVRALANLFGVSINALRFDPETRAALQEHIEDMTGWLDAKFKLHFEWFEPRATSPGDIDRAVENIEDKTGEPVHMVVVDYADKLRPDSEQPKGDKGYAAGGAVYEGLRLSAERQRRWVWTACQATRGDGKRKRLDTDHTADSIEKARVSDLWVTLNRDSTDEKMLSYFVAKFRHGEDREERGPLPTDYPCARIAPISEPVLYPNVSLQGGGGIK